MICADPQPALAGLTVIPTEVWVHGAAAFRCLDECKGNTLFRQRLPVDPALVDRHIHTADRVPFPGRRVQTRKPTVCQKKYPGCRKKGCGRQQASSITLQHARRTAGLIFKESKFFHCLTLHTKTGQAQCACPVLAEREGFEPSVGLWPTHDFQSCALDQLSHLSTFCAVLKAAYL